MRILGIDIGGTGIKGALVDISSGVMQTERLRIPTPSPAKPHAVAAVVAQLARQFEWKGAIGCGFPGVVRRGVTLTAANVHKQWIGLNAAHLFSQATGCGVVVVNDADAAGLAEVSFGAGKNKRGVVMMVTIGTGLGTALFIDGILVPNTELGHIEIGGQDAELTASDAARQREKLSWEKWATRFDRYLGTLERLFWPDLFILGGGAVKKAERFMPLLNLRTPAVTAEMGNNAGIVGAAMAAKSLVS
ncbi:MAG: ROK family protein [Anaerolineales bacterium]|nr:ROK family protein [Anaerolineales bacterium]